MKIFLVLAFLMVTTLLTLLFSRSANNISYIAISGNDSSGNGTKSNPWRTIRYAVTKIEEGGTLQLSDGIFTEESFTLPPGVNIEGQGITRTIIRANPTLYYNPEKPGFSPEKFLIHLSSPEYIKGNQYIKNLMIDGENKKLHGAIYINKRSGLLIENILIQNTNFNGLWLWDVKDSRISNVELKDCSWGSFEWCNGALNIGNVENIEIDNCHIDEDTGYGIKGLGPDNQKIINLNIHHTRITVNPKGLWNNGTAPNISIELFNLVDSEIHHCYLDNHISVASKDSQSGEKSVRIHHNTIDLENRAGGNGYGIELNINHAEIDNNFFIKGSYGIVNWGAPKENWDIHHNTFYGIKSIYPTDIVRSQTSGLHHVKIYNNTIDLTENQTTNLVGMYGGHSNDIFISNNLVVTSNNLSLNEVIHLENGATVTGSSISNNCIEKLASGDLCEFIKKNYIGSPDIAKYGNKPMPYYTLKKGSKLIDAGIDVGYAFEGKLPDVGAYEYKDQ